MKRIALFGLIAAACGSSRPAAPPAVHGERFEGPLSAGAGEVVAEVNGDEIYAADVAAEMQATGKPAAAALDDLVAAQLLAQEARRRGLADHAEVVAARKRERVRRFVTQEFSTTFSGPDAVPDEDVDLLWNRPDVNAYYNHEEYHNVQYVRVPVAKDAPAGDEERAKAAAEAIYQAAVQAKPATALELVKIAQAQGVKVEQGKFAATRHNNAVEEFAAAAFSIGEKGEIARPARTPWGWDVLYLEEVIPARHTSKAEATPDIKKQRFEASRRLAFLKWADGFVAGAKVSRNDALLPQIDVDALVGLEEGGSGSGSTRRGGGEGSQPPSQ